MANVGLSIRPLVRNVVLAMLFTTPAFARTIPASVSSSPDKFVRSYLDQRKDEIDGFRACLSSIDAGGNFMESRGCRFSKAFVDKYADRIQMSRLDPGDTATFVKIIRALVAGYCR